MKNSRFDILFESLMKSLVVEQENDEDSKFTFKDDDDGSVTCYFDVIRDGVKSNVIVNCDEPLKFMVIDPAGEKEDLSEQDFAIKFSLDYEDFKKELASYRNEDEKAEIDDSKQDGTEIKPFEVQMRDDNEFDPNVKYTKTVTIDGMNFIFSMLNDPAVDNYCECTFEVENEQTNETEYFKGLLDIRQANSMIIKILKSGEDGEMLDTLAKTDLSIQYKDAYEKLMKAIKIMEKEVFDKRPTISK